MSESASNRRRDAALVAAVVLSLFYSSAAQATSSIERLCNRYLDDYFRTFPTRATEAGRHEFDEDLEDATSISLWITLNQQTHSQVSQALANETLTFDDRLDAETLLAQIEHELNDYERLRRFERDPLYWSAIVGNATVFLLVRDDLPLPERQRRARIRANKIPRLSQQIREVFTAADRTAVAPEFCSLAARQLRGSSEFYRSGFPRAIVSAADAGKNAADALTQLAEFFEGLSKVAFGSPRLGANYAATFRAGTRLDVSIPDLLAQATADLRAKRHESAVYGRSVWREVMGETNLPQDDINVVRALFNRLGADQPLSIDSYINEWRANVNAIETFVREKKIMTLPDPLTLMVEPSPPFFLGQSVGGVYPAGPFAPDATTILFLPLPANDATAQARTAFFRDFNGHFNKMIVPHELIPGHYVQLKIAAHQAHKIRAVFPDPVYVEGWGTFCERLLLEEGWGGSAERLAHLKKQLENIARTIVDIRVHTQNMTREEVVRFIKEEALQDDQFANNMWTRAITSSPQITTYYLGYTKVRAIYDRARASAGEKFDLRRFMDGMMELGPVRLEHYAARSPEQSR